MKVEIPEDLLISDTTNPFMSLIDFVYPDLNDNLGDHLFFQERGILAPTLDSVEHVDEYMMSLIPGEEKEYLSFDSICRSGENFDVQSEYFTIEFLNGIKSSKIPNHQLKPRVGCPAMLMRNIDQANGLCNGTRLTVTHLGKSTITATVITGERAGTRVFIHRMNLIPSDPGLHLKFRVNLYLKWEFIFLSPSSRMDNSMSLSLELLLEKVFAGGGGGGAGRPVPIEGGVGCSIFTPNVVWGRGRVHGSGDRDEDTQFWKKGRKSREEGEDLGVL
ncbi:PIF1-like helicase [Medicago truncatula]|uniref:PIF1-like helicase n=1 Tax=Medicago truncatula TaxID=3880 RepID=A0A072U9H0_MEDTR|nr:PIF1-like helicase [Medicago truncatula]